MTVPSESARSGPYQGNGTTTVWPFGFKIVSASEIQVIVTDAQGVDTIVAAANAVLARPRPDASWLGARSWAPHNHSSYVDRTVGFAPADPRCPSTRSSVHSSRAPRRAVGQVEAWMEVGRSPTC